MYTATLTYRGDIGSVNKYYLDVTCKYTSPIIVVYSEYVIDFLVDLSSPDYNLANMTRDHSRSLFKSTIDLSKVDIYRGEQVRFSIVSVFKSMESIVIEQYKK